MTREPHDLHDAALRARAAAAARGDAPFDRLILGGMIADVVTGETRPADIGLIGPLIASVHAPGTRNDATKRHDASGGIVAPGLIDAHMHIESSMVTPATYARAVLPRGVTTIVWDPHEFANVLGANGMAYALAAAAASPLRTLVQVPSCVPSAPGYELAGADFDAAAIADYLARPDIAGVAEVMTMREVVQGDPRAAGIVRAGLDAGKPVNGHARGLEGPALAAFMAAGVSSDHELTSADDLMAKLRAGLTIEMRGSHDHLLPEFVAALNALGHLPQTVTLCTDDVFPDDLLHGGGLDDVLRRLVRYGMPAAWALRAATLNSATRLGRADLGLVAVGRRADLAVFGDLTEFRAREVFRDGAPVARDGRLLVDAPEPGASALRGTMHVPPLSPDDFRVPARGLADGASVRVATIERPRFTRWGEAEARVEGGALMPPDGATLIAVVHRHGRATPTPRVGYLMGWGRWRGAFATSVSHDAHNLTVFGADPRDMAAAANAVVEAGGGLAVAQGGVAIETLALPLAGLVSDAPLAEVAEGFARVRAAMDAIVDWEPPYLVFKACFGATLACNGGPHQTDLGIADAAEGRLLTSPILQPAAPA